MTGQVMERLHYDGEWRPLATLPLETYFATTRQSPPSGEGFCSALWRKYVGSWEIRDGQLYLVGLRVGVSALFSKRQEYDKEGLQKVFPDADDVFADWFTGTLRCPQGERVAYVHRGFVSTMSVRTRLPGLSPFPPSRAYPPIV